MSSIGGGEGIGKARNLDRGAIESAIDELDQISRAEYGVGLEALLLDPSPNAALRTQRIVGIALKKPFATRAPPNPYSVTKGSNSWPWAVGTPEDQAAYAPKEFELLNDLRMPGAWNERKSRVENSGVDPIPISWDEFKDDAENERGLFKIIALYADDMLNKRGRRSLRQYLEADESRRFEAGLDLTTLVFDAAVTAPLAALLGIPTVVVGLTLVGVRYGYRVATDTNVQRVGDARA